MLYFLLFCVFCGITARSDFYDDYYTQLFENDANWNPGFDIDAFRQQQLDLHNYYRVKHDVAPMTMDTTLTQQAQAYAEELALNDAGLIHCFNVIGCDYDGAGENLASAEGYTEVEANATVMWYNEIWDYNFCTTGTSDRHRPGHEGKAIGHFTQVVWVPSLRIGFGLARTSDRYKVYVVARYDVHGNVIGQHDKYVMPPAYIMEKYQDNCNGTDGGLSNWTGPGQCSRSCGGGVRFLTKTCTNPKPSLNGRDCEGETKELVPDQWCNTHPCSESLTHRDLQCQARREMADAHNFGGIRDCLLHCRISDTHFLLVGNVDDGTHCSQSNGACLGGVCYEMPEYVVGTQPPTTTRRPTTVQPTTEPISTSEHHSTISTTELSTAELSTTELSTTELSTAELSTAELSTAELSTAELSTAVLSTAELSTAELSTAELSTAELSTAELSTAELSTTLATEAETTTSQPPSPSPKRNLVTGSFSEIPKKRFQRIFTITSGATDIVIYNYRPRNARISVRFQKGKRKPTRYRKKYGMEMFPFAEQLGRGASNIMPMVAIQGPIKAGFKVIVYIYRKRKRAPAVTWSYRAPN